MRKAGYHILSENVMKLLDVWGMPHLTVHKKVIWIERKKGQYAYEEKRVKYGAQETFL